MSDTKYSLLPTDEDSVHLRELQESTAPRDNTMDESLESPFKDLKDEQVVVVDNTADIPTPRKHINSSISSDNSDEIIDGETSMKKEKRAKFLVYCMKSYCIIFVIFVISVSVYITADRVGARPGESEAAVSSAVGEEEVINGLKRGYVELRLNNRKVYYRSMDPETMANHTVLLIHDDDQTGEVFVKMGTMEFLASHGAKAVAIDNVGIGKSDPPLHLLDDYSDFYDEVLQLLSLKYNLIIACIGRGCDKIFSYYVNKGVYNPENSFLEGAIMTSPQGGAFAKYIKPERAKLTAQVATKTIVVNGGKDEYLNLEVNNNLTLLPRTQIHTLPNLRNIFYRQPRYRPYFHAALEAFIEGVDYTYDMDINAIYEAHNQLTNKEGQFPSQHQNVNADQNQLYYPNNQHLQYPNNQPAQILQQQLQNNPQLQKSVQYLSNNQQYQNAQNMPPILQFPPNYNPQNNPNSMKTLFDVYKVKKPFEDTAGYDPAHRFSKIKGKKRR